MQSHSSEAGFTWLWWIQGIVFATLTYRPLIKGGWVPKKNFKRGETYLLDGTRPNPEQGSGQ
jgi:hypothetical protein